MHLLLAFVLSVGLVQGQTLNPDVIPSIQDLFTKPSTSTTQKCTGICLEGFKVVTSSTTPSYKSYVGKCGEGEEKNKRLCVNYEFCDGTTETIVENGLTAGFGIINLRHGENRCNHLLETCCKIPEGGLSPDFDPQGKPTTPVPTPSSTARPTVAPTTPRSSSSFCGTRNVNGTDFKIVGADDNEAEYGEFPWMVAIMKRKTSPAPGEHFSICGGSLISPSVVLTVAHCVYKYAIDDLKVRVGEWDSQTTRERLPYQERNVVELITHQHFVAAGAFNDVALLVLDQPVEMAEHISTICLPEQDQVIDSRNCFVSGWGKNVYGSEGRYQDILKKIELPIVLNAQCQQNFRKTALGPKYILHESFVCAGGEKGKDACTGDGGSPLVCPDPRNPNRYLLTGMVAWGIGCGEENIPGVYAAVAKFRKWIDDQMRQLRFDTSPYIP